MRQPAAWVRALGLCLSGVLCLTVQVGCQTLRVPALARADAEQAPTARPAPSPRDLPGEESARICVATAELMEKDGKISDAIGLYQKARQLNPRNGQISRRLAVLHDRQGNFVQAAKEYEEALKLAPNDPALLNDVAYSHYCRGRWREAEGYLKRALEQDPGYKRAWVNLGMALGQQGHHDESLAAFEKAVSPGQARCNLAFILTAQGKRGEAKQAYMNALRMEPELELARAALAKLDTTVPAARDTAVAGRGQIAIPHGSLPRDQQPAFAQDQQVERVLFEENPARPQASPYLRASGSSPAPQYGVELASPRKD